MHLLYAFMGHALLRHRRIHPLDDPLDSPEWTDVWQAFAWRAAFGVWWRSRLSMPRVVSRPLDQGRTPTACCASSCPRAQTSATPDRHGSTMSLP